MALLNWFKHHFFSKQLPHAKSKGFTLIEVLISIFISGLIISGLLYLVVQLLKVDREEAVLNQTQQDTRRALDYITRELEEAVFVYPSQAQVEVDRQEYLDRIMEELTDEPDGTPIMAFWRIDPVTADDIDSLPPDCTSLSADAEPRCSVLKLRQSVYTLVVYLIQRNEDTPNDFWEGDARIVRYELTQYRQADIPNLIQREGYRDPTSSNVGFSGWTKEGTTTNGTWAVLADSIEDPEEENTDIPDCSDTSLGPGYRRIPSEPDVSSSFFTCVWDPVLSEAEIDELEVAPADGDATPQNNQDMIVYLRGDASGDGRARGLTFFNEDSSLPTLESRILVRGILNKRPE